MSDPIDIGGGAILEPELPEERVSVFHKRITKAERIPNTRTGNVCTLECGHVVQTFGNLELAGGVVLCQECRAAGMSVCPSCGHHGVFHSGEGGACVVRTMVAGYPDFVSLPTCGCTGGK